MSLLPAVFLDRDGTLIEDRGHLRDPAEVRFFPDTVSALRRLDGRFLLFLVTHQPGVAEGRLTAAEVERVNRSVADELAAAGLPVRAVYSCPHARGAGCACGKPNPELLRRAAAEHGIDLRRSWVVGDHPEDVELAANAGARGIYLLSGHGAAHRDRLRVACDVVPGIGAAVDRIAVCAAALTLRAGGLVALPTETVYGLGADARNPEAVRRVFAVKGRPPGHPVIVHLADAAALDDWAIRIPAAARTLARRFWPGPLTLVLRRAAGVSTVITGGQDTVGLRVPAHPLALALLGEFGGGVAAPSANRFGRVSPTTAEHVRADLGAEVDFVLDGGPCPVGVESTVLDLTGDTPAILRPGGATREELEAVLGRPLPVRSTPGAGPAAAPAPAAGSELGAPRAPGGLASHYAPRAAVLVVSPAELPARAAALAAAGRRVAVLAPAGAEASGGLPSAVELLPLPEAPEEAARVLYERLRAVDEGGFDAALVVLPAEHGLGLAIADRLRRAAGPRDPSGAAAPSPS